MIDPTPARAVRSKWRLLSMRGDSTRVIFGYFIFVLDEVESLAVARQSILSRSEPSDAIRVSGF
jgi:hypothetical protein